MPRTLAAVLFVVFTSLSGTVQAATCHTAFEVYPDIRQPNWPNGKLEIQARTYGFHFDPKVAYRIAKGDALYSLRAAVQANLADINQKIPSWNCRLISIVADDIQDGRDLHHGDRWLAEVKINGVPGSPCYNSTSYTEIVFVTGQNPPLQTGNGLSANFVRAFNKKCGEGCPVDDFTDFGPPDPLPLDVASMTQTAQTAASCLRNNIGVGSDAGLMDSGFRPIAYNDHLADIWDRNDRLKEHKKNPACSALLARVRLEMGTHRLGGSKEPIPYGPNCHSNGTCFDVHGQHVAGVDANLNACGVRRPYQGRDPGHTQSGYPITAP